MIPKIIHYCWFGGNPLPEIAKYCIASWEKYCPDFQIIQWDESNFDINYNTYTKQAYEEKKWAFVSDVARLYALIHCGGIYMDTDVEVIRPLDDLLIYDAVSGFETETQIPTGLMACKKNHPLFLEFLHDYQNAEFRREDGSLNQVTNVSRITRICELHGLRKDNSLQTIDGFTLLPKDYLCPKDFATLKTNITENTYVIHHFNGSWHSEEEHYVVQLRGQLIRAHFPQKMAAYCAIFFSSIKFHGFRYSLTEFANWFEKRVLKKDEKQ